MIFAASHSVSYMANITHEVTGVWYGEVGICDAGTISDHSQSANDIDPYFKSQLYVEDPGHRTPVFILPNGLSKAGELAHDRNLISAMGGIRTHNLLIDIPACYY